MNYGYIRVSTDRQSVLNQRHEIARFCREREIQIDGWIEETISGTKDYGKRRLGKLLNRVGKNDLIVCAELSRLGRTLFMIMEILNHCMARECQVWAIKENYRLGEDIQSKVMAFAFGLCAEIERSLISQRTREALVRKREEGVHLGRPAGVRNRTRKLDDKRDEILRWLEDGCPKVEIARRCSVATKTLYNWLHDYETENKVEKTTHHPCESGEFE